MRSSVPGSLSAFVVVLLTLLVAPRVSAAQASGTLQASVTVVPSTAAIELAVTESELTPARMLVRLVGRPEGAEVQIDGPPVGQSLVELRILKVEVVVF